MSGPVLSRDDVEARLRSGDESEVSFRGALLTGLDLSGLDLSKRNFSGADLTEANLSNADLSDANLSGANLERAVMFGAMLSGAELVGADLARADLSRCEASRAGFGAAILEKTSFFEANLSGSTFSQANLRGSDLRCADLRRARLHASSLNDVDASQADLREAELDGSDVSGATFNGADLRGARLPRLQNFERANWLAVDIRETDFRGAYSLRRLIIDENYLEEFRSRGPHFEILYRVWRMTSDCGRSFWRWAAWMGLIACLFAVAFSFVAVDYGDYETLLSPLYYSVITLTTLGYGDVLPKSSAAQALAMFEVCVGYVVLGGLISILANKMARRGE